MIKFLSEAFFGVLHVFGKVIAGSYYLLFGWNDSRVARQQDTSLSKDVDESWRELLMLRGGRILPPNRRKASMDYSICTVAFESVQIRVIRGRGEYRIQFGAIPLKYGWLELPSLLSRLDISVSSSPDEVYYLNEIGRILNENWDTIANEYFDRQPGM